MTTKLIYGYRLSHEDGSISPWFFIDFDCCLNYEIQIVLKNGARLMYQPHLHGMLDHWCADRELKLEHATFKFHPATMVFTMVKE